MCSHKISVLFIFVGVMYQCTVCFIRQKTYDDVQFKPRIFLLYS